MNILVCDKCENKVYYEDGVIPVCSCSNQTLSRVTLRPVRQRTLTGKIPTNPWVVAHEYPYKHKDNWSPTEAKKWYYDTWKKLIPSCSDCRLHWAKIERDSPPPFDTAKELFEWFWYQHNQVSSLYANKPTMTLEKAYSIYWPTTKWYVAVTTAPRKDPTIQKCITSLRECGWEPTVFAEPDSELTDALTVHNTEKLGVWHNFLKSARYALESDAEVIMTVQDDSLFHPDSKVFTESILWPSANCGFVSLYTPKHYSIYPNSVLRQLRRKNPSTPELRPTGVTQIYTQSLWGACALVWPRKVLEALVAHPIAKRWVGAVPRSGNPAVYKKRMENPSSIANSDTAIGKVLNAMNRTMWFVDPSPVQHIAIYSSIPNHGSNTGRRNAYRIADHTIPLTEQVPRSGNICTITP